MDNYLLSIDASTKKTGYCIINQDTLELVTYGLIEQQEKEQEGREHRRERIVHMAHELSKIIDEYKPTKIVQEDVPPTLQNSDTVLALGVLQGSILYMASLHNITVEFISVSTWHSALGILKSKGDLKEQSIKWANDKYGLDLIYKSPSSKYNQDDMADAICIGSYYLGNYESKTFGRKSKIK